MKAHHQCHRHHRQAQRQTDPHALTAQGRIQGRVVGAMPVVLGIVLYFLDPVMMMTFIRSQAGIMVLLLVLVMEVCGALLIRKIVDIDV